MTEPFATTVAAVAPVIWLVGAVEYHQAAKHYRASMEALESRLVEQLAAFEAGDSSAGSRDVEEPAGAKLIRVALYVVWGFVSFALAASTIQALKWLAEPGAGPQSSVARFCFLSIGFGLGVVTCLPVGVVLAGNVKPTIRRVRLRRQIQDLRDRAEAQLGQPATRPDEAPDTASSSPSPGAP